MASDHPESIFNASKEVVQQILPDKSYDRYVTAYEKFLKWQKSQNTDSFDEEVLLAYFYEGAKTFKPSTLWSVYSMLKNIINCNHNVNIAEYDRLTDFLKKKNSGCQSRKSNVFTAEEINKFLTEAPDAEYLTIKTVMVFGISGACPYQICNVRMDDVKDYGTEIVVRIPDSKTKVPKVYLISGTFAEIVRKYITLRPPRVMTDRFLIQYRGGKCTVHLIGKKTIAQMPRKIAEFLELPNPAGYNVHSLRRSSTTRLADTEVGIETIKRHGVWKSNSVAEAYKLEFEENTPEEERQFYVKRYPNVDMVADCRLHCTACNAHLGCAVANKFSISMHPVLRVTLCKKCHTFYNNGEFSKGEDGSELCCRWCGQGGEVYCCAKCPYVFCKKCIVQNLPTGKINEISNNDNWNCFSCSPREMWELRAQHWALVNYIEKTKQKILSVEKDDKIYELMNKDPTLCCRDKKVQKRSKDSKRRRKRRYSSTSSSGCSTPEPKRIQDHSAVLPKMVTTPVQQKLAKQSDELVCTTDILSIFSEPVEETAARVAKKAAAQATSISVTPATMTQKSATSQPPPLIIHQLPSSSQQAFRFPNRQFSIVPRPAAPSPLAAPSPAAAPPPAAPPPAAPPPPPAAPSPPSSPPTYCIVNGFSVDLNAATQQETYRLPNGTLIQVKKQIPANQANAANSANLCLLRTEPRTNNTNSNPYSIRFNVPPSLPGQPIQIHPQHQASHQTHLHQQQQTLNGINNVLMVPMTTTNTMPTSVPAANKHPNTSLGQAQTQLENQIHRTQDICQQTIGKLNTLMRSEAYNSVRTYNDVKELHLHLSYLFIYTIGRFKTLQDKCADDMKALSNAHEAANKLADENNKYTNVDDDLEVVEVTTVCIEIDSDDENELTKSTSIVTPPLPTVTLPLPTVTPPLPTASSLQPKPHDSQSTKCTTENVLAPIEITEIIDADELELPIPPVLDMEDTDTPTYDQENDEKLKSLPQVVLEKDEEIERKLKEMMDTEAIRKGCVSPISDEPIEEHNEVPEKFINESENETVIDSSKESGRECAKEPINEMTNEPINESATECVQESDEIMEISDTIVDDGAMYVSEFHELGKINDDVTNGQKSDERTTIDVNRSDTIV